MYIYAYHTHSNTHIHTYTYTHTQTTNMHGIYQAEVMVRHGAPMSMEQRAAAWPAIRLPQHSLQGRPVLSPRQRHRRRQYRSRVQSQAVHKRNAQKATSDDDGHESSYSPSDPTSCICTLITLPKTRTTVCLLLQQNWYKKDGLTMCT
jgi:hypothetical protein